VLFEYDSSVTGPKKEHPVAVVSNEAVAEQFYQHDPKNRDWIPFNLDEVPEQTGVPGNPIPPAPPSMDEIEATRKRVEETTQSMQQFLEQMKNRRNRK